MVADACNRIQQDVADVTGVAVVDVVEGQCHLFRSFPPPRRRSRGASHAGTAIEALPNMSTLIASHPKSFDSQEDAIAWQSVPRLSLSLLSPRRVHPGAHNKLARSVHSRTINNLQSARISVPPLIKPAEPAGEGGQEAKGPFTWRVELEKTEPYWRGAPRRSLR